MLGWLNFEYSNIVPSDSAVEIFKKNYINSWDLAAWIYKSSYLITSGSAADVVRIEMIDIWNEFHETWLLKVLFIV